jgi:hypothetical protein
MRVPYRIVIEPQEYKEYASVINPARILILPFSNLNQGSIPVRNWVWEHSISEGHSHHWILDDNIVRFFRLHQNKKIEMGSGVGFKVIEEFVNRYENVGLAGMQYRGFAKQNQKINPFLVNTRVYSCLLIRNELSFRWRGRYNEDTDLSLRVLKAGYCTILSNAFLAGKQPTMTMKGGNTDELYQGDGRLQMAYSLQRQHPDVVKITRKWGRWQHQVDYRPFRGNKLIKKEGLVIPDAPNEYGMKLVRLDTVDT